MKQSVLICCLLGMITVGVTGCTLESAPQCMTNEIKCMTSSEGSRQVVKICGSKSGNWQNVISCDNAGCSSEKNACVNAPECHDDANECISVPGYNFSVAFRCSGESVMPEICNGMCNGSTKTCFEAFSGTCEKGTEFCVTGSSGVAMAFTCPESGIWSSEYCLSGCDDEGKKCGSDSGCTSNGKVICCDANERNHLKVREDKQETCSYDCRDGYLDCDGDKTVCEVAVKDAHVESCEKCETGYYDCDADWKNGCETMLSQQHMDACGECSFGFGNCDDDWANGCEVHLESRHLVSCEACEFGFGNCDDRMDNGCEIEFNPRNLMSCEVCNLGYGNCDGDWSNGCEVEFNPRNLETCEVCNLGYGNCDEDWSNGCEIQLSLYHLAGCNQCLAGWENCDGDWSNGCEVDLAALNKKTCSECKDGYIETERGCVPKYCTQGESKCLTESDGTTNVYKCNNNNWVVEQPCGNSCAENECGECINGKKRCENESNVGKVQVCDRGKWKPAETCPNNYSCNSDKTDCGSCVNGTHKCKNTDIHLPDQYGVCTNGEFVYNDCPLPSSTTPRYLGACNDEIGCGLSVQTSCTGANCFLFKCSEGFCKRGVSQNAVDCIPNTYTYSCGFKCLNCDTEMKDSKPENTYAICKDTGVCDWKCKAGYHKRYSYDDEDNYCEKDSLTNCGAYGRSCTTNAGTTECKNAKCQYLSCRSGYKEITVGTVKQCLQITSSSSGLVQCSGMDSHIYCNYSSTCTDLTKEAFVNKDSCYYVQ